MASCAMQTFNNFSSDAWTYCKQQVKSQINITINDDIGSASDEGLTIVWRYQPDLQILAIQCTSKPFVYPCSAINQKIHDLIAACMEQHGLAVTQMVAL